MEFEVGKNEAGQRFDKFIRKYLKKYPEIKLSDIFFRLRKGWILVNGEKKEGNYKIQLGDKIEFINQAKEKIGKAKLEKKDKLEITDLEEFKKMIIYEDEDFLVINKPADIVVHPGVGHMKDITLTDLLLKYLENLNTDSFTPAFCYRLDRDTSGILIAAKSFQALQGLNQLIRERKTKKIYYAIVSGEFPEYKKIKLKIKKIYDKKFSRSKMMVDNQKGDETITEFRGEEHYEHEILGDISLVKAKLLTGKMHQIRIHLSRYNFPIIGDLIYGNPILNRLAKQKLGISRQLLHCYKYEFSWNGKKYSFEADLPDDFKKLFDK